MSTISYVTHFEARERCILTLQICTIRGSWSYTQIYPGFDYL